MLVWPERGSRNFPNADHWCATSCATTPRAVSKPASSPGTSEWTSMKPLSRRALPREDAGVERGARCRTRRSGPASGGRAARPPKAADARWRTPERRSGSRTRRRATRRTRAPRPRVPRRRLARRRPGRRGRRRRAGFPGRTRGGHGRGAPRPAWPIPRLSRAEQRPFPPPSTSGGAPLPPGIRYALGPRGSGLLLPGVTVRVALVVPSRDKVHDA